MNQYFCTVNFIDRNGNRYSAGDPIQFELDDPTLNDLLLRNIVSVRIQKTSSRSRKGK